MALERLTVMADFLKDWEVAHSPAVSAVYHHDTTSLVWPDDLICDF